MDSRIPHITTIAIAAFIPWLIRLAVLGASSFLSRPVFLLVYYLIVILVFAVSFSLYYLSHPGRDPFAIMGTAILCLLIYEVIYFRFFFAGSYWFLTYLDWFLPMFLIASTIYGLGKFFK